MRVRHLILDRDGVLNEEAPNAGYIVAPEQFHWLPGSLAALTTLRDCGVRLSLATNQSGIGRGLMTEQQLGAVHDKMCAEAAQHGVRFDDILFCPHAPADGCDCRKPASGLIDALIARASIAAEETLVVGDDYRDVEAAWRGGVAAALVRTGKGARTETLLQGRGVPTFDDLHALARSIATSAFPSLRPRSL